MTLYEELSCNLDGLETLYRFQGGISKTIVDINCTDFISIDSLYLYFSRCLEHHQYFTAKRINQLLEGFIFDGDSVLEKGRKFRKQAAVIQAVKELESKPIYISAESLQFRVLPCLTNLMQQNCFLNNYCRQQKQDKKVVEYADPSAGGAYGIAEDWLRLCKKLIILVTQRKISEYEVIEYLKRVRTNNYLNEPLVNPNPILFSGQPNYSINQTIYSPFTKYDIMEALDAIVDKNLVRPNSDLARHPSQTIKQVIGDYQSERTLVLRKLDQIENTRLS